MADSTLCPDGELVWKIENFSYCWHKCKEHLNSPIVYIDSLWGSKWCLRLYPRGTDNPDNVSLFLHRVKDSSGPQDIDIKCEFAVLDAEDVSYFSTIHPSSNVFKPNECYGRISYLERNRLNERKEEFLPGDVLTVRCQIWFKGSKSSDLISKYLLRTHIPVTECIFSWHTNEAFENGTESKISLTYPFKRNETATVDLQQVWDQNKKHVEVVINGNIEKKCSWKCDIRFTGTDKRFLACEDIIVPASLPYKKQFESLSFSSNAQDNKESKNLKYELKCVFGIASHDFESYQDLKIHCEGGQIIDNIPNSKSQIDNEAVEEDHSLQQDVSKIYHDKFLSDFNVKVQGKSFPVHSFILAARSPVMSRMLETNMKESIDKFLELDDLDESTVAQMLDYMYTDDFGQLSLDSALKLYYAGDKYDMPGLKKRMSCFLVASISRGNVCDILELADRHQDEHIKSTALEFIFKQGVQIMASDDFLKLSQRNPDLFIKTTVSLARLNT